jgi:hypothetical protein
MLSSPSQEPRDQALQAALRDAALLAGLVHGEFHASYSGSRRDVYLTTLGSYLADLGGRLEDDSGRYLATFDDRRIAIRFETSGRG